MRRLLAPARGVERIASVLRADALAVFAGISDYIKFIAARPDAQRVNVERKAELESFAASGGRA